MDKRLIKITSDGSHTLYVPLLDETYHSKHGAIQEAIHVFINAGLDCFNGKKYLKVLEIGFGTGLNAFLSLLKSLQTNQKIDYVGIETSPLDYATLLKLNYTKELKCTRKERDLFHKLHQAIWEEYSNLSSDFRIKKVKLDVIHEKIPEQYDLIYFDAFGPRVQSEIWAKKVFEKMYNALFDNGALVTYCAKGSVKRTLKEIGFKVENLSGPPGKREMTRAIKVV